VTARIANSDPRVSEFDPGRVAVPDGPRRVPSARRPAGPTVADLMSASVVTLPPDACALEAAHHLIGRDQAELVVLTAHGRPLGVLTARDLARCWPAAGVDLSRRRVDTLLPVRTRRLLPDLHIATAAAVLAEEGVEAAVVVDRHGALLGVLAARHVVALVAGEDPVRARAAHDGSARPEPAVSSPIAAASPGA
jgi:CBS-domain-containing membrane protein